MNIDILQGKTTEHLVSIEGTKFFIHYQVLKDFLRLQKDASEDGFDLQIASAFRDYERQLSIWNMKATGQRQLLDENERPLDFLQLSPKEIVFAIMRWSAIPGCSRHHWGTDIDVFDGKTQILEDVRLTPTETLSGGPSFELHQWLDQRIASNKAYGFYRPYATERGGVSPERWHLSHHSLSRRYFEAYSFSLFKRNIQDGQMALKEILLENDHDIYQRFFLNIDHP